MDELSTGECKEDEEGEGDQESHFGHLHPYTAFVWVYMDVEIFMTFVIKMQ